MTAKKKGYEKFEAALNKIEALFKKPTFKGGFNMRSYGVHFGDGHAPQEENYCGTAACMAGWLAMVDPGYAKEVGVRWIGNGLHDEAKTFEHGASDYYDLPYERVFSLFLNQMTLEGKDGLKIKMNEARQIVADARAADQEKDQ